MGYAESDLEVHVAALRALAERSGFDVVDGARSQQRGAIG